MSRPKRVETNFKWNIYLIVASSWCSHLSAQHVSGVDFFHPQEHYTVFTACGLMHRRCCRPAASSVHYITSCKHSLVRNHRPKHVELIGIINKPLLLHLVGYLYYSISDARSNKHQIEGKTFFFGDFRNVKQEFGDEAMSVTQTSRWYKRLKEGRNSVEDKDCSWRTSTSKDEENIQKVRKVINSNPRLTVREVAYEDEIYKTISSMTPTGSNIGGLYQKL